MTDYGITDVSTTVLLTNQFPANSVFVPGDTKLTVVGGANKQTDGAGKTYADALVAVLDGHDVTQGSSGDANTVNSVMGRLTKIRDLLAATIAVTQSGNWNITNISGTVSLPTGASTSAKQPALGTAGSASADVLTVQGIASMTALKVDGSGFTQPVSGTVSLTANSSVNVNQVAGSTVSTAASGVQLIGVADGAGNKITTNSTTYTAKFGLDGNLLGTLGTAFSTAGKVDVKGADGDVFVRQATASNLNAQVVGSVASAGSNAGNPLKIGGVFNTTQPTVTTGQIVDAQTTARGAQIVATGVDTLNATINAALPAGGNTIGAVTQASGPWTNNVTQFGGTNVSTGTGAGGAGIPRVTVSNDSNMLATQSGTWTVQPGNTPNTSAWLVQDVAGTSGGSTPFHLLSAASNNATSLKGSAGNLYGGSISNTNASARWMKFYNKATAPAPASDPVVWAIQIPGNATVPLAIPEGLSFTTGIAFAAVTGSSDTDNTSVGAGDLSIDLRYK